MRAKYVSVYDMGPPLKSINLYYTIWAHLLEIVFVWNCIIYVSKGKRAKKLRGIAFGFGSQGPWFESTARLITFVRGCWGYSNQGGCGGCGGWLVEWPQRLAVETNQRRPATSSFCTPQSLSSLLRYGYSIQPASTTSIDLRGGPILWSTHWCF